VYNIGQQYRALCSKLSAVWQLCIGDVHSCCQCAFSRADTKLTRLDTPYTVLIPYDPMAKLTGHITPLKATVQRTVSPRVYSSGMLVCVRCGEPRDRYRGASRVCVMCVDAGRALKHSIDPRNVMLCSARSRATKYGVQCTVTVDDIVIPKRCPILDIPLIVRTGKGRGAHDSSPSLDRIDLTKGYVPGNVQVISQKANGMKRNASLAELEMIGVWAQRHRALIGRT
jgi:hypothetical protein